MDLDGARDRVLVSLTNPPPRRLSKEEWRRSRTEDGEKVGLTGSNRQGCGGDWFVLAQGGSPHFRERSAGSKEANDDGRIEAGAGFWDAQRPDNWENRLQENAGGWCAKLPALRRTASDRLSSHSPAVQAAKSAVATSWGIGGPSCHPFGCGSTEWTLRCVWE